MRNEFDPLKWTAITILKLIAPESAATMTFFIINSISGNQSLIILVPMGVWIGGRLVAQFIVNQNNQDTGGFSDN